MSKKIKYYQFFIGGLKNPNKAAFNLIRKLDKHPSVIVAICLIRNHKTMKSNKKDLFLRAFYRCGKLNTIK